jgi:hypothetical protein
VVNMAESTSGGSESEYSDDEYVESEEHEADELSKVIIMSWTT